MKTMTINCKKAVLLFSVFFTIFFLLPVFQLSAAYFEFLPTVIEQPDGTIINCFASGDEFFNWTHDSDGYTLIVGEDGFYYYGVSEGDQVTPTQYRAGSVDPREIDLEPWAKISERAYQEKRRVYEEPINRTNVRAPHVGTMNNLVIYIRFSDDSEFTIPRTTYDNRFNSTDSSSMRHYFQEVSYYQLDIVSHHYPICDLTTNLSYQDSYPRSYYQPYHAVNNPNGYSGDTQRRIREHTLLANAIDYIESELSPSLVIDADNDGYVDNISFIIRGNSGNWADLLWAHRWVLYSFDVYLHNKQVWDYTFQPENQSNASTLSHEMFHTLGAPDLYRYNYNGTPVGSWDLMASGFVHMGAWMKYKYAQQNWITEIPEINSSGTYTLEPLTSPINNVYMIQSPYSIYEFFVLEYRKQEGLYESNLPGSGLLVYRIDSRYDGNAQGPPDEVYIYRHNGTPTNEGSINMAHYSSYIGRTEINDFNTNPVSFLGNGNIGGLHVHSIGGAANTITFSVTMVGDLNAPFLHEPDNLANDVSVTPDFSWSNVNVAEYYEFQLAPDTEFSDLIAAETNLMTNSYQLSEPLEVEQTYFWRVRSSNGTEMSDWSELFNFTTAHFSPLQLDLPGIAFGNAVWGDFNNDGFLDFLAAGNQLTKLYKNLGNGNFVDTGVTLPSLRNASAAWGDLTNNGFLDFVIIGRDNSLTAHSLIYLNNGDETFTELDAGLTGVMNGAIAIADYNNNGWLDLLISGDTGNEYITTLYENNNGESFISAADLNLPGLALGDAAWADFNNNGLLDLLLSGTSDQGAYTDLFLNDGYGSLLPANSGIVGVSGSTLDVGDYNNNGFKDIIIAGNSSGGLVTKIYSNNGDGTFTDILAPLPGIGLGSAAWGDFNQNGELDVILTGFNTTAVYRNVAGSFEEVNSGLPPLSTSSAAWADFDNDGDLDILLTGSGAEGTVLKVYQNQIGTNEFSPNTVPSEPENPGSIVGGCTVYLSWDGSVDSVTPAEALTYNVSISSYSGGDDVMSSMSDLTTGFRKIPAEGNVGRSTEFTVFGLPEGMYYWRVQAVDSAFAGSGFSQEQSFQVSSSSTEEIPVLPFITDLRDNYPNPFNPETTIRFSLRQNEKVTLEIFNIAGQKVTTLIDDLLLPGYHSATWNAKSDSNRDMGSGIYFYRLRTSNYQQTRKMLYLK
jgi:M6 family metalloprotease-like protein